jgi:dihydroorotate dehydrogenase (NAD+) catalytic subunit
MDKPSIDFSSPILNAAGSLGFAPDPRGPVSLKLLGAFITNPVSQQARQPATGTRLMTYTGGALLHTGHPNPGLNSILKKHQTKWERSPVPVIVHLLGGAPEEMTEMIVQLEEVENVIGVEIGLPSQIEPGTAGEIVQAAAGELPLMVRVPFKRAAEIGEAVLAAGASAISLGPPRGALKDPQGELVYGRVYGPGVFPQALELVCTLAQLGVPVVGAGGIFQQAQVDAMLAAGAIAVQVDTAWWRGGSFLDDN